MTTQGERLARIETLLEGLTKAVNDNNSAARTSHSELSAEVKKLREEFTADKAELAALKNRGIGLLIGVGAVGGAAGATLSKAWQALFGS